MDIVSEEQHKMGEERGCKCLSCTEWFIGMKSELMGHSSLKILCEC